MGNSDQELCLESIMTERFMGTLPLLALFMTSCALPTNVSTSAVSGGQSLKVEYALTANSGAVSEEFLDNGNHEALSVVSIAAESGTLSPRPGVSSTFQMQLRQVRSINEHWIAADSTYDVHLYRVSASGTFSPSTVLQNSQTIAAGNGNAYFLTYIAGAIHAMKVDDVSGLVQETDSLQTGCVSAGEHGQFDSSGKSFFLLACDDSASQFSYRTVLLDQDSGQLRWGANLDSVLGSPSTVRVSVLGGSGAEAFIFANFSDHSEFRVYGYDANTGMMAFKSSMSFGRGAIAAFSSSSNTLAVSGTGPDFNLRIYQYNSGQLSQIAAIDDPAENALQFDSSGRVLLTLFSSTGELRSYKISVNSIEMENTIKVGSGPLSLAAIQVSH